MLRIGGPALAYLAVLGGPFVATWMGESFREASGPVSTVMALGIAAPVASYPLVASFYGANRLRPLALLVLCEGVVNLATSIALAPSLGVLGVAIGTAGPALVVHAFALPRFVCRGYGIPFGRFLAATWVAPILCGAATCGVLALVAGPGAHLGWGALAALALLSLAVFHGTWFLLARVLPPPAARPGAPA